MGHREITIAVAATVAIPWTVPVIFYGPTPSVIQFVLTGFMAILGLVRLLPLERARAYSIGTEAFAWGLLVAALANSLIAVGQVSGWTDGMSPWIAKSTGIGFGNLMQRNQFASLAVFGLAALLYLVRPSHYGLGKKLLATIALVILMLGNASSASRTGLVATAVLVLMHWHWKPTFSSFAWKLTLAAFPVYILASLSMKALGIADVNALARFAEGDELCSSRLTLWSNVLELISQKPVMGWGWSELAYAHFMTLYSGPRFCAILDNAHNLPLHFAVTLGLPIAAILFSLIAIWIVKQKPWRETEAVSQFCWVLLAVVALHSMLEYPLWYGPFIWTTLISLLLIALKKSPAHELQDKKQTVQILIALAFMAFSYIAWDYHRVSQLFLPFEKRTPGYAVNVYEKAKNSFLFKGQVQFAALTTNSVSADNAQEMNDLAKAALHFSPESVVAQKVIESAVLLGQQDEALFYLQRFQVASPEEHRRWADQLHQAAGKLPN